MSKSVILVTGASSGFGLMTSQSLAQAGHTVYASMRETAGRNAPQVAAIARWAADKKVDLRSVELDVQSDASADAGIAHIIADAGRLDVIVHNAGPCPGRCDQRNISVHHDAQQCDPYSSLRSAGSGVRISSGRRGGRACAGNAQTQFLRQSDADCGCAAARNADAPHRDRRAQP
jgi:NAD(P)-dependent dehydrogenase (short-subunit alcohol dehydrogenase family)